MPDLMAALEASIAAAKSPSGQQAGARQASAREASTGASPRTAPQERRAAPPRAARRPRSRSPRRAAGRRVEVEVEGRTLSLSNLDKVLYPRGRVHQGPGDRLLHARRARPAAAPARPPAHAEALSRTAWRASYFYEKHCPSHRPDWVRTAPIPTGRKTIDFCLCDDLPDARLAGQPRRPRAAPVAVAGGAHRAADGDGLRPRPRRAGGPRGVLRGGPDPARGAASARPRVVPEDLRARRACRSTCR